MIDRGGLANDRTFGLMVVCLLLAGCASKFPSPTAEVRLNQIQVIGTHNSYHQRTHDSIMKLIAKVKPEAVEELDYWHPSLTEQLDREGMREIELDCYADPDGGRFAHPLGPQKALEAGLPPVPANDPEGKLLKPGIKVMHIPDVDYFSSVLTLVDGLRQIRQWSVRNPRHIPVFILIELKSKGLGPGFTPVLPWGQKDIVELEREILRVFPRDEILTPDDVRGTAGTLPEALREHGWPRLNEVRGKVLFGLDNMETERDEYLLGHPALQGRLMFVSVPPDSPAAAWMEENDPIKQCAQIQDLVRKGFLVRTRADEPTYQARANDGTMRDAALASGAQYVSTDYPRPNPKLSPYCVQFQGSHVARIDPVNGPGRVPDRDLE
jgi:hypothetical protein